jgi:endonuclease/exonuclease/phosphatase family metal-dependent hydrolase
MKRFFSLFLCFALLCSTGAFFVSCEKGGEETTDVITEAEITEAEVLPSAQIALSELGNFVIIRNDDDYLFQSSAKRLQTELKSDLSLDIGVKTDFITDAIPGYVESEFEILVGACNREESQEFVSGLLYNDYGYGMVGGKLVIAGATAAGTLKAMEHFIENVTQKHEGEVFFDNAAQSFIFRDEYTEVSIAGTPISEYSIVCPRAKKKSEDNIAKLLRTVIAEMSGYTLEIKSDASDLSGKEIRIGTTSRDTAPAISADQFFVGNSAGGVLLAANDSAGLLHAFNHFVSLLKDTPNLTLKDTIASLETGDETLILDYNVWMHTAGQESRVKAVLQTIEEISPDIMGLQECTHEWMAFLTDKFSSEYGIIGEGRDGTHTSGDQFNPILYRKDKYTLIDSGTRWLSETPEIKYTKVPDSTYERIFTFAVLEEKATGVRFVFISTHFDHQGGQADQAACMAAYIEQFRDLPMFMCGDYNGSGVENIMDGHGYVSTEKIASEKVNPGNTYSGGSKIDFIFTNGKGVTVTHYEVKNNNDSSDHYPIVVKYKFTK